MEKTTTEPTAPPGPSEVSPAAATTEPAPPAWFARADALLLGLLLVFSFFVASFAASNSDLWMNLAIGKRLSEGTFQFGVDPFSWATEATSTRPAVYWVHHGWLSSWIFYQLYLLDGGVGTWLVLFKAFLFTAGILLLSRVGWTPSNRWFVIICLAMAALSASPRLFVQPLLFSFVFVAVAMYVLDRAGVFVAWSSPTKAASARCLWCLPPLFAVWANLDQWFILGPLLVGLCWLSTGVARWSLQRPIPVAGSTLGLVFGAGLAACVLNPHGLRIFQLPPELAYLLLSAWLPVPDALAAGGHTLQALREADPNHTWTISPLSTQYWQNANIGKNIAGIAFYPLLVLGLLSFVLTALAKPQPGAPTFHAARFLVWALFAIMAVMLYRMIGFFALVAAPLTAMTLGEFLHWQQLQTVQTVKRRDRGLQAARFLSFPFLLMLIYLAWPGWLHGSVEYNSVRRVAWEVRSDRSLQNAAETLQALHEKHECGNVFNFSHDFPGYCAWYAPDVKCFMDTRFALFAGDVAVFTRARQALMGDARSTDADWQTLFEERHIDQVVLANFIDRNTLMYIAQTGDLQRGNYLRWWVQADRWRERYGDNRTMVFAWAGANRAWPLDTALDDWNRVAFGKVPPEECPPPRGTMQPQPLGLVDPYLYGTGPTPLEASECQLLGVAYQAQHVFGERLHGRMRATMFGSLANVEALPGGIVLPSFISYMLPVPRSPDFGPPALPLLIVRAARQAVGRNPEDSGSQEVLKSAYELLHANQENYWIANQGRMYSPGLRERLRQIQFVASLYSILQLQPDRFDLHMLLADRYEQNSLLDFALEHRQLALKALEIHRNQLKSPSKQFDASLKKFEDAVKKLDAEVQLRLAKWKEKVGARSPLDQAEFAYVGAYEGVRDEKPFVVRLGLGKKALEILAQIDPHSLPLESVGRYYRLRFELLIALGRVDFVAQDLAHESVRRTLPAVEVAQYEVLAGGVLGDYVMMDQGLGVIEKALWEGIRAHHALWLASVSGQAALQAGSTIGAVNMAQSIKKIQDIDNRYNELFNDMTLRGIGALEAGDTKRAREIFRAIHTSAGDKHFFTERPIATRYRELLDAVQAKQ